jgi:competence protein ComEC
VHDDAALTRTAFAAPIPERLRDLLAALWLRLLAERERWFLWLPALLASGIATAFGLTASPTLGTGWAAMLLALSLLVPGAFAVMRERPPIALLLVAPGMVALGFGLAVLRTHAVGAPVLPRPGVYEVQGRVSQVEELIRGRRVTLDRVVIPKLGDAAPAVVRINLHRGEPLRLGEIISVLARLQPPMAPAVPGGFDFARQAWFGRLGGLGFALGSPRRLASPQPGWELRIAELRARMSDRITDVVPGEAGAVSSALLTGVRAALTDALWRDFQLSGLAHILSISGLHMVLVAGVIAGTVRYAIALVPPLALRVTARRVAAAVAIVGTGLYTLLAGASVPAERSFLMIAVALLGVMTCREPISMRLLAWAGLAVLLWRPESLLGASFQLSFAAVGALIAVYESRGVRERLRAPAEAGWLRRTMIYVAGVAATTLIAGTATAPLGAFHFQTIPTYGLIANLVAVPVTTFWIMPAGLLSLLLMPVGLDGWTLPLMGAGVEILLWTARTVAGLPGASVSIGLLPTASLLLFGAGGVWLCLWQRRWRWLGIGPILLACGLALLHPAPDLLVAPDLGMIGARLADGTLVSVEWLPDGLRREGWARAIPGAAEPVRVKPGRAVPAGPLICDPAGCVFQRDGQSIALARRIDATVADCGRPTLLIAANGGCRSTGLFVGRRELLASQGLAIRVKPGGPEIRTVAGARGRWPWVGGGR